MPKLTLLPLLGLMVASKLTFAQDEKPASPPPMPRRPSIILIVADGLGYGDLGCYGQQNIKTPNLDQLAKEGVRFTSFYAASPKSAAARVALLTGRDTGHLKLADDSATTFPDGVPTIAELLQQVGYHTGCVGEWQLGETVNAPFKRGFIEWVGLLTAAEARTDFPQYISRYRAANEKTGAEEFSGLVELPKNASGFHGESVNAMFAAAAGNFVNYNKPDQFNQRRPYFLYLPLPLPSVTNADSAANHSLEPWPAPERARADAIVKLDECVGRLIAKLKETKQESNTLVFLTSDTGARADCGSDVKYHKRAGKFQCATNMLGEGDLRIPLLVWGPDHVKSGEENFASAAAYDLVPTFLEIARAKPAEGADGLSLLSPLRGKPQPVRHEFLLWQTHPDGTLAARKGEWKFIRQKNGQPDELYNLNVDPQEKSNLAADQKEIVTQFEDYLRRR
ncbi:MAG: Arylsulfatase [Verrucomicrobiota bacterium]|jgi:arylsulfatase A-like enzyme